MVKESIIPVKLEDGFLSGYSAATAKIVLGDPVPLKAKQLHNGDSRRDAVISAMIELNSVYSRDSLSCHPVCYGMMEGVRFMKCMMVYFTYEQALEYVAVALDRLAEIAYIECVFHSHRFPNPKMEPVTQDGQSLSDGEAYCYGIREGLRYAVQVVQSLTTNSPTSPASSYLTLPRVFQLVGCMAEEQRTFVDAVLPGLRKKFHNRPSFYDVDIMTHGWSRASDCLMQLAGVDYQTRNWERKLYDAGRMSLALRLVVHLRGNTLLFHIFRLGFGWFATRPSAGNKVFHRSVGARDVPLSDVQELLTKHKAAGKTVNKAVSWMSDEVKPA